jgi:ABC-type molybdate transport system substrate-binding protein
MVKNILYIIICLLWPGISICISDLHLIVDESLSIPIRKVINEYTKQSKAVITSDFLSAKNLIESIDSTVDIVISVNYNVENAIEKINFANDQLYLCISKASNIYKTINKNDNLNTILKIIKKHSTLMIPSEELKIGSFAKIAIKKLNVENYVEIDNFQDLVYSTIKSGAFCILPHSLALYYKNINIESIIEIPQSLYEQINYNITIVNKNNIEKSEKFLHFLVLNMHLLEDIGFKVNF